MQKDFERTSQAAFSHKDDKDQVFKQTATLKRQNQ